MKSSTHRPLLGLLVGASLFLTQAAAQEHSLPGKVDPPASLQGWMPGNVSGYLVVSGLGDRLASFLESDVRRHLESIEAVRTLLSRIPRERIQEGMEEFRTATGKEPLQVLRDVFGKEVVLGARQAPGGPELVVLTRAAGEKDLSDSIETIRQAAASKIGYRPEGMITRYGGHDIETIGEASFVRLGPVLALSNRSSALEEVIDLAAGRARNSVESSEVYKKAARVIRKDALISFAVRAGELPWFPAPKRLDNPVGSILAGGWLGALGESEVIAGSLRIDGGSLDFELSSVLGAGKLQEKYRPYYPEGVKDSLGPRLKKRGVLVLGQIHRDLKGWWEHREDFLLPAVAKNLSRFSQQMSFIFGGRSFEEDILPRLGSTVTVVARNQEYAGRAKKPSPSIPALAAILELEEAGNHRQDIASAYQTVMGLVNAGLARKGGGMPYVLKREKMGEAQLQVTELKQSRGATAGIVENFTPSLALVGSHVVLSSSAELARVLVEELQGGEAGGTTGVQEAADSLHIDAASLRSLLQENSDLIIENGRRQKGDQAEGEFQAILDILKRIRDLSIRNEKHGDVVQLKIKLRHRLGEELVNT